MSMVPHVLLYCTVLSGFAGLLSAGVLMVVALVSVLAPTTERRKDARSTLTILLRRRLR